MLISVKLAPTYDYPVLAEFWRTADQLGFHGIWDYDHFYGLVDPQQPTYEGWTTLAAMAAQTTKSRVGCLVGSVTYHNPALLASWDSSFHHDDQGLTEGQVPDGAFLDGIERSMVAYMEREAATYGTHWYAIARHMLGLRHGLPGARRWRQVWSDHRLKGLPAREVWTQAGAC